MKNLIVLIHVCCLFWTCSKRSNPEIELPFYNSGVFTPEWIAKDDQAYDSIHTISTFSFQDQNGENVTNAKFDGKVYAANFFFSICPGVCPKMKNNLMKVQETFIEDDRVKILSHTVMPWVDSVARLKEYALLNDIDSNIWHLVTGSKQDIYGMARSSYFADEGFGKSVTSEEDFLHTENVVLIDQKRRIRGVYSGTLEVEINRMIEDIQLLLKEEE